MKLLDTDICIGLLKAVPSVVENWRKCNERCAVSVMSVGELCYGAAKARDPEAERQRVGQLIDLLGGEVQITKTAMMRFGEIKASLESKGQRIDDADIIIATTALENGMTLVTGNTKHFSRIPDLIIENWF